LIKVKFITTSAGAGGVIRPGDVVEVSESEASLLINRKYAVLVEPAVKPLPEKEEQPETPKTQNPPKKPKAKKEN